MVSENKTKEVKEIVDFLEKYPIVAILEMKFLPSAQLQKIRNELSDVKIKMFRKNAILRALKKTKKKDLNKLSDIVGEIPALLFTEMDPFRLAKLLRKTKTPARAKVGDILSNEVSVETGPTNIAAGPAIGLLQKFGLKTVVKDGKIAIENSGVIAKKGDKVTKEISDILTLIDAKPMEIGLNLLAVYKDGIIYAKEELEIDEEIILEKIRLAASEAKNLSLTIGYPTKDNIAALLKKAENESMILAGKIKGGI